VSRVVTRAEVDRSEGERFLRPRDGFVLERRVGDGAFEAAEGPVRAYRRRVEVEDLPDGRAAVTETIDFDLAIPFFGWLFAAPVRRLLARGDRPTAPWWAPPQRLDAGASSSLAVLAVVAAIGGYLAALLTTTIAFAGRQFGAGPADQSVAGVVVRFAGAAALVGAAAAADRLGRRRVILWTAVLGSVVTATGALVPSLPWLAASQALARSLSVALLICVSIAVAEEMPPRARAYGVSVLGMSAGLGGGLAAIAVSVADMAPWGWRLLYLLPLPGLVLIRMVARRLRETRRFERPHPGAGIPGHGGRLGLLAVSAVLGSLMAAPASFFVTRYLLVEQGFSAPEVSLFTVVTGTPGVIGVIVGGRLADTRGRRLVGAVAVTVGTVTTALFYLASGAALWILPVIGSVIGAAALPALGVYGPELFPTALRGRAGGLLALAGLVGSAAGLLATGLLADRIGSVGPVIAVLAAGPLALAAVVLVAYPETAGRTLEDLNPEDRRSAEADR
jgi:MFS family permease